MVRKIKWITLCMVMIVMLFPGVKGKEPSASLLVDLHTKNEQEQEIVLTEAGVSIYQIESYVNGHWQYLDAYQNFPSMEEITSASSWKEAAKQVYQAIITQGISYTALLYTNAQGQAYFDDLSLGTYLVVVDTEEPYQIEPFLIRLPLQEQNDDIYDVQVMPKIAWDQEQEATNQEKEDTLVSTGRKTSKQLDAFIMSAIFMLICSLVYSMGKNQKFAERDH